MSQETRAWVCERLHFTDDTQEPDLMDPSKTSTNLIAFLQELLTARSGIWYKRLQVNAVRTDHPTPDGPNGHEGGNAIDLAQYGEDDALCHLTADVQACENAKGIGLGGPFQQCADALGGYNEQSKLFQDNDTDHIHIQVVGY